MKDRMLGRGWRSTAALGAGMAVLAASLSSSMAAPARPAHSGLEVADAGVSLSPPERAVVIVVLDGARWQDVLGGVDADLARDAKLDVARSNGPTMPHLAELARTRGAVIGAPGSRSVFRASGPNFVSLPGYTEILTGRPPVWCANNQCPPATRATFVDEVRAGSESPRDVALFSSWPDIMRIASLHPETVVMSGGRSLRQNESILREDASMAALLDRGAAADPDPGAWDFRPDRFTAPLATRYLEVARPRFLFLSLGETDEYAHTGDYAGYLDALAFADDAIAGIVGTLDRMGERGKHTTVYITADHGRARDFADHGGEWPESARSWLVAIGDDVAARGAVVEQDETVERHLADIAPTARALLAMPADPSDEAGTPIAALLPRGASSPF